MLDLLLLYFCTKYLLTFLRISAACTNLRALIEEIAARRSVSADSCIMLYFLNHSEMLSNLVSRIALGLELILMPYRLISLILSARTF
jgi:hypothetical protein